MPSENGWEPPRLAGREDMLVWKDVPGTDPVVRLQVMRGLPEVFIPAWAADWNEFIEGGKLRDADSASFTATNSVATSNHLNGTACDLNWNSYPFRKKTFSNQKRQVIQEMTDFYEGWMFWAGYWQDPVDEMHSQMGYNTWNRNTAALDFISRKIRSDGKSTFRRGPLSPTDPPQANGTPTAPPPVTPTPADTPTAVLYDAVPVIDMDTTGKLVGRVMDGLRLSQCTNVKRIAMWLAQIGQESDGFRATEEYAKNGRYAPYIGRTWIQITWDFNYRAFGQWCQQQGLVDDSETFIKNPASLAADKWAAIGPAWYWTVARPKINEMSDAGDLIGVTKAINGGTNGLEGPGGRRERYNQAIALGDRLLLLAGVNPTTPPPTQGDESMANVPQDQWDRVYRELTQRHPSRSAVREPGEGLVDTWAGMDLNTDGNVDLLATYLRASLGYPPALARLQRVAANQESGRSKDDALLAQAMLASFQSKAVDPAPTPAPVPAPVTYSTDMVPARMEVTLSNGGAPGAGSPSSPGQVIGQAFDALHALLGAADELTDAEKTTYNALISALNTKIGVSGK